MFSDEQMIGNELGRLAMRRKCARDEIAVASVFLPLCRAKALLAQCRRISTTEVVSMQEMKCGSFLTGQRLVYRLFRRQLPTI
jgi:hypothetical protein